MKNKKFKNLVFVAVLTSLTNFAYGSDVYKSQKCLANIAQAYAISEVSKTECVIAVRRNIPHLKRECRKLNNTIPKLIRGIKRYCPNTKKYREMTYVMKQFHRRGKEVF